MRVLFFYPENPILKTQGNNSRVLILLEYFKSRNIKVDFVSERTKILNEKELEDIKKTKLVENAYLLERRGRKKNQLNYFFNYSIYAKHEKNFRVFNRLLFGYKDIFNEILNQNKYDFIFISYVDWAELVKRNKIARKSRLIIDTHDFLTSQFQNKQRINEINNFNLPIYFEKEINYLKLFDDVLAISIEEKYLFSQFLKNRIHYLPHTLKNNFTTDLNKNIDVLYVASDNQHNIDSANWFFEKVFKKLDSKINVVVVGKICKHINYEAENLTKISYIEDLNDLYKKTRVSICPMLTGTGIKIKVVEALSYGIPVVCNERGVDGLLNKTNNGCLVTNDESEFANYISLLLNDEKFYQKNTEFAKDFFNKTLSNNVVYETLDKIFLKNKPC